MPTLEERVKEVEAITGWTPGPWVRDCWDVFGQRTGTGHLCEVTIPKVDDFEFWTPGETEGNISLITAAPEMRALVLELWAENQRLRGATSDVLCILEEYEKCGGAMPGDDEMVNILRAALAQEPDE